MIKYFLFTPMIFVLLGCGASPKELAKQNDKTMQYLINLTNCRIYSTKGIDDGVSSVEIIAAEVIKTCTEEAKSVMENNMLDKDEEYRKAFYQQMMGVQTSGVISIVLKHRRETKNKNLKILKF